MRPTMDETNAGGRSPGPVPKLGEVEFAALIVDQRERWLRGEPVVVEAYLEQHPSLRAHDDTILDLIYNEVVVREEIGEEPRLDEYQRRFPHWASQLAMQFDVHRAITADSSTLNGHDQDNPAAT